MFINTQQKYKMRTLPSYLLHPEQHHSLFGHVFGKHLKAEQHVGGRHHVQGMGRQEEALETVLPDLRGEEPAQVCHQVSLMIPVQPVHSNQRPPLLVVALNLSGFYSIFEQTRFILQIVEYY